MRALALLTFLLFSSPALAQYWGHYENARFGYAIDIPPDFEGNGESDNGDGQIFYNLAGEQGLTVWGGNLQGSFEDEVGQRQEWAGAENWAIGYRTATPDWAVFSGQRDHRIMHQRMITLCDGHSYAAYQLEYNIRDLAKMDAVIEGLNRSFLPGDC